MTKKPNIVKPDKAEIVRIVNDENEVYFIPVGLQQILQQMTNSQNLYIISN